MGFVSQSDNCWVGVSEHMLAPLHVFADGSILIASERSGYSHLYVLQGSGELRPVTTGEWPVEVVLRHTDSEVTVWVDEEKNTVTFVLFCFCFRHVG